MSFRSASLALGLLFAFGCSSAPKSDKPAAAPAAPAPAAATAPAKAQPAPAPKEEMSKDVVTCVTTGDKRTLEVKATKSGGCETIYTKFGKAEVKGTSKVGLDHCQKVLEKIKGNLVNSKYKCSP